MDASEPLPPPVSTGESGPPTTAADPRAAGGPRAPQPDGPATEPAGRPPPPDVPAFLRGWRRYQVVAQLGAGGMGEVYRAWDPQLQRWVALKFLHHSDPLRLARFQREAQSQARVDHPGVCRVYEVGEVDGRPYIAMQEIAGATLGRTARELPLEERVRLVARVADAVHAAHRIGLIHRDLKPGNILVAESEDGLQPFVVDFGLARDQRVTGLTVSGSLSGTPGYMAPEQASGDDAALDRRADVYSLGAILYELLSGQLPLPAANLAEAIIKLLQEEPPPLRQVVPSLPADLETVVMKCLEKDPARRYDSAKALAADLWRWLDGEPVEAQRASLFYRLRKRAAQHPRVTAAGAVAVVLIVALAGTALRARWEAAARADAARRFGTAAKEMESLLRVGELAPAHDTRVEREAVRAAMRRVEGDMKRLGKEARGPGLYALGRGALTLGESEEALRRLQAAWEAGERGPEVSYALGQALGQQYFERLERLVAVRQAAADAPLRRDLERRFRDPAREQLRLAAAPPDTLDSAELVEALLALYEGRYAAARTAAERAAANRPWLYEARHLQGLAWRREGEDLSEQGDLDGALAAYAQAGEANAQALAIARSGAPAHAEECARQWAVLRVLRFRRPIEEADAAPAVRACERALALDARLARAWGDKGRVLTLLGEDQVRGGIDPSATVAAAHAALTRQLQLDGRADDAWAALGNVHDTMARWQLERGTDPRPELRRAADAYRAAIRLEPRRAISWNGLGNVRVLETRYLDAHGLPADEARRQAIAAYERAVSLWDGFAGAHANIGYAWTNVAAGELAAGRDPRPALQRAIAAFRRGLALNAAVPAYHNNFGNAYLTLGEYQISRGEDGRAALLDAVRNYEAALRLKPQYSLPHLNIAYARRVEALGQVRRGEDPTAALALAAQSIEQARRLAPTDADNELEAARQALLLARWEAGQRRSPLAALDRADAAATVGLVHNPESADLYLARAERARRLAAWLARDGGARGPVVVIAVDEGLGAVERALALHPRWAEALVER
ncbi:MAG TPA: serine/threonine-protein kinase, partial [Thermoanaerobaculia bacterium]|nr:serine/threonine-protein kinase [Thermoanaerobaculia bacterium]